MRAYIDVTGKTEEEAIRKGLEQLDLEREDVAVEILERAKTGFLGFGSAPAKVRISYGEERADDLPLTGPSETEPPRRGAEPVQAAPEPVHSPVPEAAVSVVDAPVSRGGAGKPERKPPQENPRPEEREDAEKPRSSGRKSRRGGQRREKAAQRDSVGAAASNPSGTGPQSGGKTDPDSRRTAPQTGSSGRRSTPAGESFGDAARGEPAKDAVRGESARDTARSRAVSPASLGEEETDERSQAIRTFLTGLLAHMGQEATVKVYQPEEGRYKVLLEGGGLGSLIGRRGETLDAMQQLTSYAVNRTGSRIRIQLDAEGYREKREQSLQRLAKKTAAKVVKSRRSFTLEPMNAYERHVIHTALQEYPGVVTFSTGVDPNRRVIVAIDRERA